MKPQDCDLSPPKAATEDNSTLHSRPPEHDPDIETESYFPAPQRHRALIHGHLAFCVLLLALPGCDNGTATKALEFCVAIGVCARPALPTITVDFIVHARRDSTTNAAVVSEDYANVLAAAPPGSPVRVWKLEERVQDTAIIHTVEIPTFHGRTATQRRAEQLRFIAVERARLSTLVAPLYTRPRATHAPIFESLARVAMSDGYGRRRLIVLLTDGREISSDLSLDFDSDSPLPTVAQLGTTLRGRRVLEPGALSAVNVYVVRVGPLTTPRRRSARGVGRELHIRDLLRSAIQQSGARVEIASEGLHLTPINHE